LKQLQKGERNVNSLINVDGVNKQKN